MATKNTSKDIILHYSEGDRIIVRVVDIRDYGCIVEDENGVNGLIMVSDMDWLERNIHPSRFVNIGDQIEVMVVDINERRQTLGLSLKHCKPNPWEQFALKYNKQDTLKGIIDSITNIGIFVKLDSGVTGHIFPMDISDDHTVGQLNKGDQIDVVILNIDSERERISLKL